MEKVRCWERKGWKEEYYIMIRWKKTHMCAYKRFDSFRFITMKKAIKGQIDWHGFAIRDLGDSNE